MSNILKPTDPTKKNTFILKDFPPDTYSMTLNLPDMKPATRSFTIRPKEITRIEVTFLPN